MKDYEWTYAVDKITWVHCFHREKQLPTTVNFADQHQAIAGKNGDLPKRKSEFAKINQNSAWYQMYQ